MRLHADSSAVLRWIFQEDRADEIEDLLRDATKVVCSRLTLIECRRTIPRAVAQQRLDEVAAGAAFDAFAQAASRWAVLEPGREVTERAERPFPIEPVRTLDALHLASALILRQALPDLRVPSTDERVRANGRRIGLEVVPSDEPAGRAPRPRR